LQLSFASYIFLSLISGNLNFLGHSKNVTFLSPAIASKYQNFPLTEVSVSREIHFTESPKFDFGGRHFESVLGSQAVLM